jgi:hypothetical protein
MRRFSIPMYLVHLFGKKASEKRVLLRGWQKLHFAALERTKGQHFDVQSTRLPPKRNYSWRVYTGWSLLHLVAFEPMTFVLGGILFVPACVISLFKLGKWLLSFVL